MLQFWVELRSPCLGRRHVLAVFALGQAAVAVLRVVFADHYLDRVHELRPGRSFGAELDDGPCGLCTPYSALLAGKLSRHLAISSAIHIGALVAPELACAIDGMGLPTALDDATALWLAGDAGAVINAQAGHQAIDRTVHDQGGFASPVVGVNNGRDAPLTYGVAQCIAHGDDVLRTETLTSRRSSAWTSQSPWSALARREPRDRDGAPEL